MRYREDDNTSVSTVARFNKNFCTDSFVQTNSSRTIGTFRSIEDCLTPDYHRVKRRGGVLPYLPVSIRNTKTTVQPLTYLLTRVSGGSGFPCTVGYGDYYPADTFFNSVSALPGVDSGIVSQVVNAAIASAKSEAFDALTSLAELHKTVRMVANRISRTFNIAQKASRRASRERTRKKQRETFDSAWLEYRYGWRPLVREVSDACEQLFEIPYTRNKGKAYALVDLTASSASKVTTEVNAKYTGVQTRTGQRRYQGYCLATGTFGTSPEFRPFQTAWELVPFSFVVDWFFDVGSFISAITPIPGVDIRASGYSIHDSYTVETVVTGMDNPATTATNYVSSQQFKMVQTYDNYDRVPAGVALPGFYPRLDNLKLIDIAALVLQRAAPLSNFLTKR